MKCDSCSREFKRNLFSCSSCWVNWLYELVDIKILRTYLIPKYTKDKLYCLRCYRKHAKQCYISLR